MAIKTLRVFAEYTSTGFVPMPVAGGIDYGYTLANTFPSTQPSTFQTDDPDLDVTVTAMTDFYVWIRISGTAWNPSYTRNVRVYPDSPDINSVVMNMIIATGPAGVSSYSQIVQTANRLYFNGATTDSVYNSKFAGKTYINELNFGTAPQLATVATSGAYADLTGKPALATVATSGSYADLSSKPSGTAPISYNSGTNSFQITQANTTTNGFLSSTDWNTFNNKYLLPSGGTTAQYLRGDGTLATFPTTLDSTRLILNGRNTTGTTLAKGTVVYINGVQGNTPLFARAIASADSTSAQTLGVVEFDIPNNSNGVVVLVGAVNNLDTSSYTEGVQLYLSGTVAGAFTSSKILAPTHLVYVGIVTRAHPTLGVVEVKIQNGYELDEIHDVQISSPADKHILYYDNATTLWKHSSVTSVLGFTPYNATNPSNYIALTALSASAPLSYNNTTGAFSIAQANGSTNGFLSSTDWTTFNSKQNALTLGNVSEVSSNVLMFPDGGTGKTIGNLSIQVVQAGATTNGYLSSTDWTTFNNKQNALTLTTTGTSGAATLSGATLNIPQYQTALTNPVTGTGTSGRVVKFTGTSAIGDSIIRESVGGIGINGTASTFSTNVYLDVIGNSTLQGGILQSRNSDSTISGSFFVNANGLNVRAESNHALILGTNATERIRVTSDGKVGIGISSPVGKFNIVDGTNKSLIFQDSGITDTFEIAAYSASGGTRNLVLNAANLLFGTGTTGGGSATERMRITSSGNVGIGTTSPTALLEVSNATGSVIKNTSGTRSLTMESYSTDWNYLVSAGQNFAIKADGAFPLMFYTNGVQRFIINSNGDTEVRAGFKLNLSRGDNARALQLYTNNDACYIDAWEATSEPLALRSNGTSGRIQFHTNGSERMRIASDGKVGVGTSSPTSRLEVRGNSTDGWIRLSTTSGNPFITSTNEIGFQTGSGNNNLYLFGSGNVGINNTVDTGYRLYVSGNIYATSNITANSDLTLKKNLQLIENPAEKLMSLNGYSYQWKENDEYQYGVIAQEVEKVMSYAVSTGNNGIKGVAYNQLTPLLIEGFKLHNSEITQLKERVKYLEAKLA